ncbi:PREDICTED: uncharacterized protein LOC106555487 isoform X2 [Thamnophis sirtalis]|uniref:Uncharacterized protein LOC106555487 isoform X2 n=1 Tax=Thamnophis sirtalis TaxID=35019 RepID=A0A6I9YYQ0_9SAUR|nr:PREDICTED: uncharacterized protein LOC106555487 isoform X2 [Thamnophis sirtalis]
MEKRRRRLKLNSQAGTKKREEEEGGTFRGPFPSSLLTGAPLSPLLLQRGGRSRCGHPGGSHPPGRRADRLVRRNGSGRGRAHRGTRRKRPGPDPCEHVPDGGHQPRPGERPRSGGYGACDCQDHRQHRHHGRPGGGSGHAGTVMADRGWIVTPQLLPLFSDFSTPLRKCNQEALGVSQLWTTQPRAEKGARARWVIKRTHLLPTGARRLVRTGYAPAFFAWIARSEEGRGSESFPALCL